MLRRKGGGFLSTRAFLLGLVAVGAALRLWQYAGNASLELDELALARAIIDRPLSALLLTPLPYDQAAPQGFLLAEKAAVTLFGPTEYALRFLPLLCSLASLVFFWRIAERVLRGPAVPFALAIFALRPTFILYGATVKQYSVDIAAALLLLLMALELRARGATQPRSLLWGVIGAMIAQFSQPAVFVLAGVGFVLVFLALAERDYGSLRPLSMMLALWGGGAAMSITAGLLTLTPETTAFFHLYWRKGFMPNPSWPGMNVAFWLWRGFYGLFDLERRHSTPYAWPAVYVGLAALGGWSLWRRCRDFSLLSLGPLGVVLVASMAHLYPFRERLVLFLAPVFLLAAAEGAEWAGRLWATRLRAAGAVSLALIAAPPVYDFLTHLPVYTREETKPAFADVQARRLPGDAVYVYYAAWHAVFFYATGYGAQEGEYVIGRCHIGDTRAYLRELDQFRGRRVWVLFTHVIPSFQELPAMVGYLDRIGIRLYSRIIPAHFWYTVPNPPGDVHIYLYDLSDEARLASTSAETYPVPPPSKPRGINPSIHCSAGPHVPIANSLHQ